MLRPICLLLALSCVACAQSADHHASMQQNGDHVMGFSHDAAAHHFRLSHDGGSIEVTAKDPSDQQSIEEIRMHLQHIAGKFSRGDFTAPMLIHSQTPPGVPTMRRLKQDIKYTEQSISQGAVVRIASSNSEAVSAIHEFLKFQIDDHQTGDPKTIGKP